ncbi:hypothetical protein [Pseudonocardia sp. ICBG1142]|uniref:hypothetical protein n=1 Tax=Pseudonocardia sp. ICBG1142 TaxID=2846760 RepID=UPI001CF64EBC|nr:hypothetical protein [Pseudonocardia sp. ICBG1142]
MLDPSLPPPEQLAALVTALDARLARLETIVTSDSDGVGGAAAGTPDELRPTAWPALDIDAAAAAWDELGAWVATVLTPILEPSVRQIPLCWPVHTWGRETLSWLHAAYRQAYGPHGSGFLAAEWHTRWVGHAFTAFDAPDTARGGVCDRPEHRTPGGDPGRRLRVEEWRPWFDWARAADLERRRAAPVAVQAESSSSPVPGTAAGSAG